MKPVLLAAVAGMGLAGVCETTKRDGAAGAILKYAVVARLQEN